MAEEERILRYTARALSMVEKFVKEYGPGLLDEMLRSGAIDVDDYGDDFELPKLLAARLLEIGASVRFLKPLHPRNRKVLKNLAKFV